MNKSLAEPQDDLSNRPKNILHFCGHIISNDQNGRFPKNNQAVLIEAVAAFIGQKKIDYAYGSLAAGSDILIAEALLEQQAEVHIVLPYDKEKFIENSVRCAGNDWQPRFQSALTSATTITQAHYNKPEDENSSYALCTEIAMGLALLKGSESKIATTEQITIWDETKTDNIAGTYPDMLRWQRTGNKSHYLSSQKPSDVHPFSQQLEIPALALTLVVHLAEGEKLEFSDAGSLRNFLLNNNSQKIKLIDLNHDTFGASPSLENSGITRRALGILVYRYSCLIANQSIEDRFSDLLKSIKQLRVVD